MLTTIPVLLVITENQRTLLRTSAPIMRFRKALTPSLLSAADAYLDVRFTPEADIRRSTIAMSASLIGRLGSSAFRLSTTAGADVTRGLVLLFGIGTKALPSWDSKTRWNDLWGGLAATAGRSKRTCELTSSIVPRGTPFHRLVELELPPMGLICVLSCRCGFSGPAELGAIKPNAVHDHRQPPRQGDDRLFHAAAPGDLHRPSLEPRPFLRTHSMLCAAS